MRVRRRMGWSVLSSTVVSRRGRPSDRVRFEGPLRERHVHLPGRVSRHRVRVRERDEGALSATYEGDVNVVAAVRADPFVIIPLKPVEKRETGRSLGRRVVLTA